MSVSAQQPRSCPVWRRLSWTTATMIAAGLPTPSGSGQRSLGRGPPDLEAADLAEGDLVLDYGAIAGQANS